MHHHFPGCSRRNSELVGFILPLARAPGTSAQTPCSVDNMLCHRLFADSLFFRAHRKGLGVQKESPKFKNIRINVQLFTTYKREYF